MRKPPSKPARPAERRTAISGIVLVKPPERSTFNFGTYSLGALAAAIDGEEHVSILDATDLSLAAATAAALAGRPRIIGVTVMSLSSVGPAGRYVARLRGAARASKPRPLIVCGGHGASCQPGALLSAGADAVVIGEGETTFRRIVADGFRTGMTGTVALRRGKLVAGPPQDLISPLDLLPTPRRDLMPVPPDGIHLMETSRGCPHACRFCETTRFYGRRWRPLTPERTAAEVRRLVEDQDALIIHFVDDNFAADPPRVLAICREIRKEPRPAVFMTAARADDLMARPEVIPAMAEARILRLNIGVETLDPSAAEEAGKALPPEVYREAFGRLREAGIFSVASFIVGLPGEKAESRAGEVERAIDAGPDAAVFIPFIPFPGTPFESYRRARTSAAANRRAALAMTESFYRHPTTRARLRAAAAKGGIVGGLARGTLARRGIYR